MNNTADGNQIGFWLESSSGNILEGNTATNNDGDGFKLLGSSSENIIKDNMANDNSRGRGGAGGFELESFSSNNTLYHNNVIDNTQQAFDRIGDNRWDYKGEGNYWSDYTGKDANLDGIGDTPYAIGEGTGEVVDNFPFMQESGWLTRFWLTVDTEFPSIPFTVNGTEYETGPDGTLSLRLGYAASYEISVAQDVSISEGSRIHFLGWEDGPPSSVRVTRLSSNTTLRASHVRQHFVDVDSRARALGATGGGWHDEGTTAMVFVKEIVIIADGTRAVFAGWTGDLTHPEASISFVVDSPKSLTATWKLQHLIAVSSQHGSPTGEGWYDEGSTARVSVEDTLPVSEGTQLKFVEWRGDLTSTSAILSFTVDGPKSLSASWKTQHFLTIEKSPEEGGVYASSGWLDEGTALTVRADDFLEIVPGLTRLVFTGWSGAVSSSDVRVTVTLDTPKTLVATWTTVQHYLTVKSRFGEPQGEGWHDEGSMATFTVTSPVGFLIQDVFTRWSGDITSTSLAATVIMDRPRTVTAIWRTDYTQLIIVVAAAAIAVAAGMLLVSSRRKPTQEPLQT